MNLVHDYVAPTPGNPGGRCRIRLYLPEEPEDSPVASALGVICTEPAEGTGGMSITNCASERLSEVLAAKVIEANRVQEHYAHQHRKEGRRSPSAVLSWVKTPRFQEEDLERAFFLARHTRTVDGLGYLVLQRHRLYAEEGLAGMEVAVWVAEDELTVEYDGETLSRYEVECEPATGTGAVGRLRRVKSHTLFENSVIAAQLRLFDLGGALGEEGWVKFVKLAEYASRRHHPFDELQQVLFTYEEAV